jgi:sugar phosphate isomerase/epimerase
MTLPSRRRFLQTTVASGTAALAATPALTAAPAPAIDPIQRPGPSRLHLSLAAYSYNRYLRLKNPMKPAMTLTDFIDAAATMPLRAVELTAYYFPQTTLQYLGELKGRCTRLGLDISGTAVGNNFCTPDAGRLKEDIAHVKRWIEHTSRLGGKTIRVFAGNVAQTDKEERARNQAVAALQEVSDHAGQFGIYVALENHGGITGTIDQMLTIVRAVKHNWFGVNLDTGNFHSADPYADLARLAPYAVVVQMKTEIHRMKTTEDADLARLTGILRKVNFRGYVALEYEAQADPRKAVPEAVVALRKLTD